MTQRQGLPARRNLHPPPRNVEKSVKSTRRAFLTGTGKKAVFVLPSVRSLTARQAAAGTGISCSPLGALCAANEDYCSLNCRGDTMTCDLPIGYFGANP